jgi:hypothetical protein
VGGSQQHLNGREFGIDVEERLCLVSERSSRLHRRRPMALRGRAVTTAAKSGASRVEESVYMWRRVDSFTGRILMTFAVRSQS